jgi:hypothetical protein
MKNLTIKKTYSVNGIEFETKEAARVALARQILDTEIALGVENVINKAPEIISALKIVSLS